MTNQEIEEGNKKIELHNKFCFMKKQLPMYKRIVPLRVPFMYALLSCIFTILPTLLTPPAAILMASTQISKIK